MRAGSSWDDTLHDMIRTGFRQRLDLAECELISAGALVRAQLTDVLTAVRERDVERAEAVIAADDRIDEIYIRTEGEVLNLLALQAPVAGDLRLVSAIMHSNMHLERMGDLCVNIAKFVLNRLPYPYDSPIVARLDEMGARATEMLDLALSAFSQRNLHLAERLPVLDQTVNSLNRGMLDDLKQYAGDEESFEWASRLILVARYLERFGDHLVDMGEQVSFLVTGTFREFTDASHPAGPGS